MESAASLYNYYALILDWLPTELLWIITDYLIPFRNICYKTIYLGDHLPVVWTFVLPNARSSKCKLYSTKNRIYIMNITRAVAFEFSLTPFALVRERWVPLFKQMYDCAAINQDITVLLSHRFTYVLKEYDNMEMERFDRKVLFVTGDDPHIYVKMEDSVSEFKNRNESICSTLFRIDAFHWAHKVAIVHDADSRELCILSLPTCTEIKSINTESLGPTDNFFTIFNHQIFAFLPSSKRILMFTESLWERWLDDVWDTATDGQWMLTIDHQLMLKFWK